ncbi:glycoside hydrolase family 38 C-terminal domain-containing protein [Pedobacter sp. JCM 36344]|uniref:glycoside hydrolase family 38 C-terminal domain-containing protein n=1 Tax=Pedobacter sp. JCM 36344 TaxID=3374280 RepID=UPI00397ACC9A
MKRYPFAIILTILLWSISLTTKAQNYFIDGYHGGVWGHYPLNYTTFISDMLDKNPFWKLNLEIEPVTWDVVKINDPTGYQRFKKHVEDQSIDGRIEFVNPSYGQAYLFNIQGESVIRQLEIGMAKIRQHFPTASFESYSSEEPCFTSALPQILKSFGYKYAALKNPNTMWGGYTTAFGDELVNWTGPDGSTLLTVPRYESEQFKTGSTWQTVAWNNDPMYLKAARAQGIQNPIGMCIQDAGWKNGPWLGQPKNFKYTTWKDYIANTADHSKAKTWNFTQENVQVSLVWGSQILQQLAQNTRKAENKIIVAEKLNAINSIYDNGVRKTGDFKAAWQNLLLAEHHDSWIVPYNIVDKVKKSNWADQVKVWTDNSNQITDSLLATNGFPKNITEGNQIRVYNTTAQKRKELVAVSLMDKTSHNTQIYDPKGYLIASQKVTQNDGSTALLFEAEVNPIGYNSYSLKSGGGSRELNAKSGHKANKMGLTEADGKLIISTDLYRIIINPAKGGIIESLKGTALNNKEFVKENKYFNEMKGYFYADSLWQSSANQAAKVTVVDNGPLQIKLKIEGTVGEHTFTQYLCLQKGDERIQVQTTMDWKGNPGIGENYMQKGGWKQEDLKKAFYNDKFKFRAIFPLNLKKQKLYKNAGFDVLESKLTNTYYSTWDSIKNNIIVDWVDVSDENENFGMALITDHTTSYQHDENGILGLTLQYSGMGLWGRNYSIKGPSTYNYTLVPHANNWENANVWNKSVAVNEPFHVVKTSEKAVGSGSLITLSNNHLEISSIQMENNAMLVRVFNPSKEFASSDVTIGINTKNASLIELNNTIIQKLPITKLSGNKTSVKLNLTPFGIRTIKLDL